MHEHKMNQIDMIFLSMQFAVSSVQECSQWLEDELQMMHPMLFKSQLSPFILAPHTFLRSFCIMLMQTVLVYGYKYRVY